MPENGGGDGIRTVWPQVGTAVAVTATNSRSGRQQNGLTNSLKRNKFFRLVLGPLSIAFTVHCSHCEAKVFAIRRLTYTFYLSGEIKARPAKKGNVIFR